MSGRRGSKQTDGAGFLVLGLIVIAAVAVIALFAAARGWFVCLILGVLGAWLLWHRHTSRAATRLALQRHARDVALATDLGQLLSISSYAFEHIVGEVLEGVGYSQVQVTRASGDQGIDLHCIDAFGRRCIVQCKQYAPSNPVGGPAVRDLIGTASLAGGARAIMVTTAGFTRDARSNAERAGIELIDGTTFVALARQALSSANAQLATAEHRVEMPPSACLTCGNPAPAQASFCPSCGARIVRDPNATGLRGLLPPPAEPPRLPTAGTLDAVIAVAASVLLLFGGIGTAVALSRTQTTSEVAQSGNADVPTSAATDTYAPTQDTYAPVSPVQNSVSSTASDLPTPVSDMDLSRVESDPHAGQVERIFDTYFNGINTHDGELALSVFASEGQHDPRNETDVSTFQNSTSTTYDSHIAIDSIEPATVSGQPGLHVEVQFESRQSAAQGYQGQICSLWDITYALARMGSSYGLIGPVGSVTPKAC